MVNNNEKTNDEVTRSGKHKYDTLQRLYTEIVKLSQRPSSEWNELEIPAGALLNIDNPNLPLDSDEYIDDPQNVIRGVYTMSLDIKDKNEATPSARIDVEVPASRILSEGNIPINADPDYKSRDSFKVYMKDDEAFYSNMYLKDSNYIEEGT